MLSHRLKQRILLVLLPTLFAWILPAPQGQAAAKSSRKAVIKSCASPEPDRGHPVPRHYKGKGGPSGGYGALGQPAPAMKRSMAPMPPPLQEQAAADSARGEGKPEKGQLDVHQAGKKVDKEVRKASSVYLSNDDSMSLASAQRIIYAINNFLPIYRNEIRPHEFLNYFHFKTNPVATNETFSVNFQMAPREKGQTLALAVQGKEVTKEKRRPAIMTFIVDKSGSMAAQDKMSYLKEGLETLKGQFKKGDVINVVEFDHETCNAIEGFQVGRDNMAGYNKTVEELAPRGSTNLHAGLVEGYKLAEKFYDPSKINRVILVTDAIANTGQLSPELMASIGKYYDTQKIALSGIGVGLDFNDDLLNTLTDKGKGAYLFLGIKDAIPRVFGSDFISLLDTVARDVHFQATFPKDVHLDVFYGEEVSTVKAKVQPIHYFANTSQLFLLDLTGKVKEGDRFQLKIEYEEPTHDGEKVAFFPRSLEEIQKNGNNNVSKARLIMAFAELLEENALPGKRPYGGWRLGRNEKPGKDSEKGKKRCGETLEKMKKLNGEFSDQETGYVIQLAEKYCSRY